MVDGVKGAETQLEPLKIAITTSEKLIINAETVLNGIRVIVHPSGTMLYD